MSCDSDWSPANGSKRFVAIQDTVDKITKEWETIKEKNGWKRQLSLGSGNSLLSSIGSSNGQINGDSNEVGNSNVSAVCYALSSPA